MSEAVHGQGGENQRGAGEGHHGQPQGSLWALAVGAIGVVFGDIGTSPLYALKETFAGHHPIAVDRVHLFGVISLIFWTMIVVVTIKYVFLIMRADNKGEGGSLALLALITRMSDGKRWTSSLIMLGVFATALFYGDSIITPAISVLSAVEGLGIVSNAFDPYILPISVVILVALFMIQSRGTEKVGRLFGPVMLLYFVTIAVLGLIQVVKDPSVLIALSPHWIVHFVASDPKLAFLALGAVVLSITGAEALYADMGHFGRRPISIAWLYMVFPCLILCYLGQAAVITAHPEVASTSPFFALAPKSLTLPLVILATAATVIASQAVISGAYSITQQAIQLGFLPRMAIKHTSAGAAGQIYVPALNWALMVLVILLIVFFRTSSNLAAAYGLAVTGTMFITSIMMGVLATRVWKMKLWQAAALVTPFLLVDGFYLASNATKIPQGGWFPLAMGLIIFTMLTTWSRGRALMRQHMAEGSIPVEVFAKSAHGSAVRVPGTAIYMASSNSGVPSALLHNIKHNKVLHERVVILTVAIQDVPYVEGERVAVKDMGNGFYRMTIKYGFLEETDVPAALKQVEMCGDPFAMMKTSFFLSRQTLIASEKPGMALWREKLFAWMLRNAASAMEFFRLPTNRVVELGSQLEI